MAKKNKNISKNKEIKINELYIKEAKNNAPKKGHLDNISDVKLGLPPCSKCGGKKNNKKAITRVYCEKCERVICRNCIDLGVYGSVSDMQSFVNRKKTRPYYYFEKISCPYCQTKPFHQI